MFGSNMRVVPAIRLIDQDLLSRPRIDRIASEIGRWERLVSPVGWSVLVFFTLFAMLAPSPGAIGASEVGKDDRGFRVACSGNGE